jgi:hypothetical protein
MSNAVRSTGPTRGELLRWELFCIPAEMAGVAVGLFFGLGRDNWEASGFILFIVLCLSGAARYWHYIGAALRADPA